MSRFPNLTLSTQICSVIVVYRSYPEILFYKPVEIDRSISLISLCQYFMFPLSFCILVSHPIDPKCYSLWCLMCLQVHCRNSANQICEAQEFETSSPNPRINLGCCRHHLLPNLSGHELYRAQNWNSIPLHVLQLGFHHIFVHGLILHPMHRHGFTLYKNISGNT